MPPQRIHPSTHPPSPLSLCRPHTHAHTHTHAHAQPIHPPTHPSSPLALCRPHAPGGGGGVPPGQHAGAGQRGRRRAAAVLGRAHRAKAGELPAGLPAHPPQLCMALGSCPGCPAPCVRMHALRLRFTYNQNKHTHAHTHARTHPCAGLKYGQRARLLFVHRCMHSGLAYQVHYQTYQVQNQNTRTHTRRG